jgi:CRISPR-associated protein Csx10
VDLELHDAFLNTELVGGFNRKWGLPLPQALSVHMGSVLIFKDSGCEHTLLGSLEARGIGERRVEGFGRIAFNRQRRATLRVAENVREDHNSPISIISDGEAHKLIRLMLRRMLRQRLDEGLLAAANAVKIVNPPSNAQISRLRDIVIKELRKAPPGTSMIHQFIKSIEARSSARRQFERSTVTGELLLRWLKRLLRCESERVLTMDDNEWKQLLRVSNSDVGIRIGGLRAEIDDQLRLEYVLRYIDLVLAHAARQRGEEI